MPSTGDDLMDMARECDRLIVQVERLTKERDEARALLEDLLSEIENTGDYEWWRNARADYEAIKQR